MPKRIEVKTGESKSCGCLSAHGQCKGPEPSRIYTTWANMKRRCLNSNNPRHKDYGGRGIKLCKEWLGFILFYEWALSHGYQDNLTIERINNNGNYEPDNCKWIPRSEQPKNSRRCIPVVVDGVKFYSIASVIRCFNVPARTVYDRLRRGLTIQQALGL